MYLNEQTRAMLILLLYLCVLCLPSYDLKENFVKVDRDYVLKTAELAKTGGVEDFHLISAQGANPNSSMFILRLKVKWERFS